MTRVPLATRFRIGADYLDGEQIAAISAKHDINPLLVYGIARHLGIPPRTRIANRGLARKGKPRMYRRWQ